MKGNYICIHTAWFRGKLRAMRPDADWKKKQGKSLIYTNFFFNFQQVPL